MILTIQNISLKELFCHQLGTDVFTVRYENVLFSCNIWIPLTIQRFLTRVSPAVGAERDAALDEVRTRQMPPETPRLVANIRFALFHFVINHGASSRHQDYVHTIPCSSHAKLHVLKQQHHLPRLVYMLR
jgi:hypothetical protein